jgi:hypothetical protein
MPCQLGKILNPITGRCVIIGGVTHKKFMKKDGQKKIKNCLSGKILNPITDRCLKIDGHTHKQIVKKISRCAPGKMLNPTTGRCKKNTIPEEDLEDVFYSQKYKNQVSHSRYAFGNDMTKDSTLEWIFATKSTKYVVYKHTMTYSEFANTNVLVIPSDFKEYLKKQKKKGKCVIVQLMLARFPQKPSLGHDGDANYHSNLLIFETKTKEVFRFDPHGRANRYDPRKKMTTVFRSKYGGYKYMDTNWIPCALQHHFPNCRIWSLYIIYLLLLNNMTPSQTIELIAMVTKMDTTKMQSLTSRFYKNIVDKQHTQNSSIRIVYVGEYLYHMPSITAKNEKLLLEGGVFQKVHEDLYKEKVDLMKLKSPLLEIFQNQIKSRLEITRPWNAFSLEYY